MKHGPIRALAALLMLSACASAPAGVPRLAPPDATLTAPCPHPSRHLGAGNLEIMAGRIGDDLILCGQRQAALAEWAAGVVATFYKRAASP